MTTNRPAYEIPAHVLYRQVDGQMVLLDLDQEQYFGLDEIGAEMVQRLTEGSVDEAIDALLSSYEVGEEQLREDLDALVASLLEAGLLAPVGDPG